MNQILLSDLAVDQLRDVAPATGRQLLQTVQRLRAFPESAPPVQLAGYEAYRQLVIRPYRVIYRYFADEQTVRVYCVLHLRRTLPAAEFLQHQIF